MKKIDKPSITQDEICNSFKNLDYKDRIIKKSNEYDQNIYDVEEFLNEENEFSTIDNKFEKYMKNTYSNRFSSSNESYKDSYEIYQKIRSSVEICPYCNYFTRTVRQLDHYLPKSIFPSFAITANNLVPICKECNEDKDNYYSTKREGMLLHPYYDEVANDILQFLKCKVIENCNIGFQFYIEKLEGWDEDTYNRVKFHFEKLKLNKLYQADFIADFTDFIGYIEEIKEMFPVMDKKMIEKLVEGKVKYFKKQGNKPWSYSGFKSVLENNWCMNTYMPQKLSVEQD